MVSLPAAAGRSYSFAPASQEQDESRSFYPRNMIKTHFTSLLGYLLGKGGISFPIQGMSPMLGFLLRGGKVVFAAGPCSLPPLILHPEPAPLQPFRGNLVTVSMNEITKLCLSCVDQYTFVFECVEPLGHI